MDIHKGLGNANKLMSRLLYFGFNSYGLRISKLMVVVFVMQFQESVGL